MKRPVPRPVAAVRTLALWAVVATLWPVGQPLPHEHQGFPTQLQESVPTGASGRREEARGLFRIYKNGRLGFIDRTGRVVIEPQSNFVVPDWGTYPEFMEGLAMIEVETDEPNPGALSNKKKIG